MMPVPYDAARCAAAIMATMPCGLGRDELAERLEGIYGRFVWATSTRAEARAANFRKLEQLDGAIRKTRRLLAEPGIREALLVGIERQYQLGELDLDDVPMPYNTLRPLEKALARAEPIIEKALSTPALEDPRRDVGTLKLVAELMSLSMEVTGAPIAIPRHDAMTGAVDGAFIDFFRLAMVGMFRDEPPSDEAIRHKVREAVELGEVVQKIVEPRLGQRAGDGTIEPVTQSDEVTHDSEADRRRP